MPKLKCECSEVINLSGVPSRDQYLMIYDEEYDNYSGLIDAEILYNKMTIVVKCPLCSRLYIYNEGFNSPPVVYCLE
ncbi:hypothetical protein LNQ81_06295 [Myroides sp. M-43]|uniref:hypothetical protein n=1 Tax=Myroides oncorhynchi TaxID=2893756 RepID=UPI001E64A5DA|nr:hypothetical protein [Myroides oncorhynchi]MCC9042301.1 hypothetical protein [Myroides oncorhynchi]